MKQSVLWILTAAVCLLPTPFLTTAESATATDGTLTADERAEAIALLEATRNKVLGEAAALSDAAWSFQPGPDRWSVAQVVEHLLLTEGFLWQSLDAALATEVDPEWAKKTEGRMAMIKQLLPDRSQRFQAPAPLQPHTEKSDLSRRELVQRYREAREKSLAFARETEAPIKAHLVDSENFGPMSAHHWLVFIALHNQRHNQQIDEILADPKLPG